MTEKKTHRMKQAKLDFGQKQEDEGEDFLE